MKAFYGVRGHIEHPPWQSPSQLDTNAPLGLWYLGQGPGGVQSRSNIKNHTESAKGEEAVFKTMAGFYWESFRWKLSSSSPAPERRASCCLRERADESGTLADQSVRACEQVYGGNEGLYLFGKTRCGLIARREECLKRQYSGCWLGLSRRGRWWGWGLPFHLQPLAEGAGESFAAICTLFASRLAGQLCSKQGWMGQLLPLCLERDEMETKEGNRETDAREHCLDLGARVPNPSASRPLKQPGRAFSISPHPCAYRQSLNGDTPTHPDNLHTELPDVASKKTEHQLNLHFG